MVVACWNWVKFMAKRLFKMAAISLLTAHAQQAKNMCSDNPKINLTQHKFCSSSFTVDNRTNLLSWLKLAAFKEWHWICRKLMRHVHEEQTTSPLVSAKLRSKYIPLDVSESVQDLSALEWLTEMDWRMARLIEGWKDWFRSCLHLEYFKICIPQ